MIDQSGSIKRSIKDQYVDQLDQLAVKFFPEFLCNVEQLRIQTRPELVTGHR